MADDSRPPFGELLRRYRQAAGLSQDELGLKTGLSTRAIRDLERGVNQRPRNATLMLLADGLGLAAEERRALETAAHADSAPPALSLAASVTPPAARCVPLARALPAGTVTFLFTDIEGSTRRWEQFPAAMRAALALHDTILRDAVTATGGAIVQTGGDSFVAAFPTAHAALTAALEAQLALAAVAWAEPPGPLRVRMALHTGPAEVRADGYHAEYTLNRTARLLAAGYGGQVLLTDLTRELLREHLPDGVTVRDLGAVRLRDLLSPLHVYQLLAPDLPADFPPLKTLDAPARAPGAFQAGVPAADGAEPANPYKGLRAFQESDAADFFGRETLTARLVARLAEAVPLARFLVVVGPSGSGKSSVVRAGLVPALHQGALPGSAAWPVLHVIPGPHPLEELEAALLSIAVNPPASLLQQLSEDARGLVRAVKRVLPRDETSELVLIIDQFEEVFTLVADEAARVHFLTSLCVAVSDPRSRVRIIATLRADFYDRPLLYPDPGELVRLRTEVVLPLTPEELYRAITAPAARVGVSCEAELVTAITQDVGEQPGTLPLLQYALTELFERRTEQMLTLAAYRDTGGVLGALARRAEETYAGLTSAEQALARQVFLRLVTLGEGVEDTRRRVRLAELSSLAADATTLEGVLEVFGRYRLLTFDRDPATGGPTVEVAHEALLRTWGRLREWLEGSREALRVQRRLGVEAADWARAGQEAGLLAAGTRLAQFEGLGAAGDVALTAEEQAYLAASGAERDRQAAAETARQAHELQLAREAAEAAEHSAAAAQRTAAAQRSAANRLRVLVGALGMFLLVAAGLALFALSQQAEADRQRVLAQSNAATAVANGTRADQQRATAEANGAEANTQRGLAQNSAATAVASEAQAQANFQRAYAQRLAAEANTLLHTDGSPDLIALLSIRSLGTLYLPQADADLVAAAGRDYPVRRFSPDTTADLLRVGYSPDGRYVATASAGKMAWIWDARTGQVVHQLEHPIGQVSGVKFSPDGKYLLTGCSDMIARIWDVQTGLEVRRFVGHTSAIYDVAFAPDGKTIASGGTDATARLWDVQTGKQLQVLNHGKIIGVADLAFSPDGKYLATAGADDQTAWLWDVQTGQEVRRFRGHTNVVLGVAFSPDGQYLATGSTDDTARLWNVQTGAPVRVFTGHTNGVGLLAYSPDGKALLTSSFDTTARLWDVQTGQELRRLQGHTDAVVDVAFSPDGRYAVTTSWDNTAALWDLQAPRGRPQFKADLGFNQATFSPDGRMVLTAGVDHTARLWDAQTGQELRRLGEEKRFLVGPTTEALAGAAFSPDGKIIATGSTSGTVVLWDALTGQELRHFSTTPPLPINDLRYAPDGKTVFTIHHGPGDPPDPQGNVGILWDAQTGREVRRFTGHTAPVFWAAYSPNGKYVLTASADKSARLWDVQTGAQVQEFDHPDFVREIGLSADGKWVVTGCGDGIARIWDVQTGQLIAAFDSHAGSATAAISPDGKYLLTGLADHTARLWDIATRQEVRRLVGQTNAVRFVTFAADGKSVLTVEVGNGAQTARLWDLDYHDTIRALCARLARDFTDAERTEYEIQGTAPTCAAK